MNEYELEHLVDRFNELTIKFGRGYILQRMINDLHITGYELSNMNKLQFWKYTQLDPINVLHCLNKIEEDQHSVDGRCYWCGKKIKDSTISVNNKMGYLICGECENGQNRVH